MLRGILISLCLICSAVSADTPVVYEDFKLLASDTSSYDYFGDAIDISNNKMIVGAYGATGNNSLATGAAYIYKFNGTDWIEESKLIAKDGESGDHFGQSVSIHGNIALVGAQYSDDFGEASGSAYIFTFDGNEWIEETKLTPNTLESNDFFGCDVSLDNDIAIIGAYGDDFGGSSSGAAYVYKNDGISWTLKQELHPKDSSASDFFGDSVSCSGNRIFISAYGDDDNGSYSGSVYIYEFDAGSDYWAITDKLLASDGEPNDAFGLDEIHVHEDVAIIGASRDADLSGSAYIFRFNGQNWFEEAKIFGSETDTWSLFGSSVFINDEFAIVGAVEGNGGFGGPGSAYMFRFNGTEWIEEQILHSSDREEKDLFGKSVSVHQNTILVGAISDDAGESSGSIYGFYIDSDNDNDDVPDNIDNCYLYNPDQADCNGNGIGDVCDVADSTSFDCDQNNVPDECQPDCDGDGFIDACDNDTDVDSDGIPDNCEEDCNGNTIPDDFEIELGIAQDCNGNGVPDECDFADGAVEDCNGNGIPDSCDIADGTEEDCNENDLLDICELVGLFERENKLIPSDGDGQFDFQFGFSVSIDGDAAIIGTFGGEGNYPQTGSAYIYRFNGSDWIEEQKLYASDGAYADWFGCSVSISGNIAIVGAYDDDSAGPSAGSAYIYRFNGVSWTEEAKLTASDSASQWLFGSGVSISDNTALIGAWANGSGAAYIYRFNDFTWIEEAKLTASDGDNGDHFGYASVSISGDKAIVGAHRDDTNGTNSGAAYIYQFDGTSWLETAKLVASDGEDFDYFGASVATYGNRIVIGADGDDDNGLSSGSAYIYQYDEGGWIQEEKLIASDGLERDVFGRSVAIDGERILIGAASDETNVGVNGSAYLYEYDGGSWGETKLIASDGNANDHFGHSVSISDESAIIGARYPAGGGGFLGSTYIFDTASLNDCNLNGILDECDLEDPANDQNNNGVIDECECVGDADLDGYVNVNDLLIIIGYWGNNTPQADLNFDGIVDVTDLLIVVGNWGTCE